MSFTVTSAFSEFMKETVNLATERTEKARDSRDWLLEQISRLPEKDAKFPTLYSTIDIHFGSFSRKTKIRPLDDIDLMIGLDGDGCTYSVEHDRVVININESTENLKYYTHNDPNNNLVNSRKIIEAFKSGLKEISHYEDAEIKRNQEATTLKLKSYEWNFDIVPCFITREDSLGNNFYLIPDGDGHWKKTDPRVDKKRTTDINVRLKGNVLDVIRVTKYWQKRSTMPTMSSYLLETILLNYYSTRGDCYPHVDLELGGVFNHLASIVYNQVNDTKGFIEDLNTLTREEREKISARALADRDKAYEAHRLEYLYPEKAIKIWRDIFGDGFPSYGEK